jgi:hypothetical protein
MEEALNLRLTKVAVRIQWNFSTHVPRKTGPPWILADFQVPDKQFFA